MVAVFLGLAVVTSGISAGTWSIVTDKALTCTGTEYNGALVQPYAF
jgi:hypothetical protein